MAKQNMYSNNKTKGKNIQNKPVTKAKRPWWVLAVKFLFLFIVVASIVIYTDAKGYFEPDQSNNHTTRKWDSFYKFTEKDTVDVVLVGNSHCYAGVNPKNLSTALGANCFVLASPSTTIMDSYYCLKEALERTHPTVAIIETYGISNSVNHELKAGGLSEQFKSYNARKNLPMKLASMPVLFSPEYYIPAWSKTIRNHDFIFRDRKQIERNIEQNQHKHRKKDNRLYLGRFVSFTTGIEDSTMAKYDSLGAPVDGTKREVNKENIKYVQKIIDLCREHNVTPVFVTLPMYYRHIENYPAWKKTVASVLEPTGAAWLDLQEPYDTTTFDRNCFENTMDPNQHMTYTGSLRGAYKIAHFLVDSLKVDLPKRNKTTHWNDLFYGEEGYFENYPSRDNDTTNVLIFKNKAFNGIEIADCLMIKGKDRNTVFVKVKKGTANAVPANHIRLLAVLQYKGQRINTYLDCARQLDYDPFNHYLYAIPLLKEAELLDVLEVTEL